MTRLSSIGQIAIPVHDVARATAFYRDALGLSFLFDVPGRMSFFDAGGVRLMLSLPEGTEHDHPASVLYFRVADIEAAYRELGERGVEFIDQPHKIAEMPTYDLWMVFFRDGELSTLALMSEVPR